MAAAPTADDLITVYVYGYEGEPVAVIPEVSLGDRHAAADAGRETLYTATLWGYLAARDAQARRRAASH